MGFFSQTCRGCEHSVISSYAATDATAWMTQAVVLTLSGSLLRGEYDGYGTVDGREYAIGESNEVWHQVCWDLMGSPTTFTAASNHAGDQGYFFDDDDYPSGPPSSVGDLERLRDVAEAVEAERQRAWEQAMADFKARQAAEAAPSASDV